MIVNLVLNGPLKEVVNQLDEIGFTITTYLADYDLVVGEIPEERMADLWVVLGAQKPRPPD